MTIIRVIEVEEGFHDLFAALTFQMRDALVANPLEPGLEKYRTWLRWALTQPDITAAHPDKVIKGLDSLTDIPDDLATRHPDFQVVRDTARTLRPMVVVGLARRRLKTPGFFRHNELILRGWTQQLIKTYLGPGDTSIYVSGTHLPLYEIDRVERIEATRARADLEQVAERRDDRREEQHAWARGVPLTVTLSEQQLRYIISHSESQSGIAWWVTTSHTQIKGYENWYRAIQGRTGIVIGYGIRQILCDRVAELIERQFPGALSGSGLPLEITYDPIPEV